MTLLRKRAIGATQIEVTIVGIGTAFLGRSQDESRGLSAGRFRLDHDLGVKALCAALDAGIGFIDTAPYYGTQPMVGDALRSQADKGSGIVLNSKVGRTSVDEFDFSADGARRTVAKSLDVLGRDHLDLVAIHDAVNVPLDEVMGPKGAYSGLVRLKDEGVIGAIGTACYDPDINADYIETGGFDYAVVADAWSLLNHRMRERILPAAARLNTGLIIANPLERGLLAEGAVPGRSYADRTFAPEVLDHVRHLEKVSAKYGLTILDASLQWLTRTPQVASAVPGAATAAEAHANALAAARDIPEAFWSEFEPLLKPWPVASLGVKAAKR